ncbi:amidohydrolase family protein [Solirubrobacter soli]|uniref:amidohydrolase family protein n=1 Tax=Solirubrobacter soli TaxID=363832 RepID=UPI00146BD344|nr:amidohydrolase family protein [Solirubrobacter soli]
MHFTPDAYRRELEARSLLDFPLPAWSTERALGFMDVSEIDRAVLSLSPPGVAFGDQGLADELARSVNEATASMAGPRFAGLAVLPLPDVDRALAELEHALDVLALDGVVLLSNLLGRYLGEPAWEPLFDELDARAAYVLVHPAPPPYTPPAVEHPVWVYEFPFETTRAIATLISAGAPERWPRIRLQVAHLGGAIPFLAQRLASLGENAHAFLRRLYYDTALATHPVALQAAEGYADPAHVVFGSDWPYVDAVDPAATTFARNGSALLGGATAYA